MSVHLQMKGSHCVELDGNAQCAQIHHCAVGAMATIGIQCHMSLYGMIGQLLKGELS